ncbi:MAG: diphthine--ammonia ligase [Actinobacteria bacterium]|nr:diphthine--ammonia ligase [Actinomycetota bacterium]MBU1943812.1 diphthine--ammonia ligase [Actinomycetota bacterium]MBU2689027.1 diphthine--ammonia ligase [Actinomycetota bacterium]
MKKAIVAWSGGKDSALALHRIAREDRLGVEGLLTTVTASYDRITMHGVRKLLLERQAESLGLPLLLAEIPAECSDEVYDRVMGAALEEASARGVETVVFGDVFLEDVRRYREERLARVSMEPVFPLWGSDTGALAREFIDLGFRALLSCVDSEALDGSFAGREYDHDLLADLPPGVDPCGENGEFHTFVWDGPGFARPLSIVRGEVVVREARFHFQDLM